MEILATLLVLNVAAFVTTAKQLACSDTVQCPCGRTGKNVTVCAADARDDLCSRWSKCLTCQDGLDRCLECMDHTDDGSCSPETGQPKLSRQKRQNYNRWNFGGRRPPSSRFQQRPNQGYPTAPVQQGGGNCPELNSPKLGSIRCLSFNRVRTCVGRCLPGYSFEDQSPEYEITLTCSDGYYTPLGEFPPCKSGGYCDLVAQGSGSFNCTTGMEGTRCDIICSGRYVGRFFCYPGRPWQPTLPQCMRPKETESCRCEYGGRCDSFGNCVCPVGRTGRNCETIVQEKPMCTDPGFVTNGFRRHPNESESSVRQMFEEGDSVVYGCTSDQYALQGSSLLTCKSDGTWSKPLPKCIKTAVSPDRSLAFCRDPGIDPNGTRRPQSPPNRRGFPQGSQLAYSCNQGYDLEGEKSLFCLVSGKWSSERPKCNTQYREPEVVENYCPNPGPISNGKIAYNPPINSRRRGQSPADPEFPEGGRLQYSCNSGHFMEGTEILTCLPDGGWSAPAPSCSKVVIHCPNPGPISNGKIAYHPPFGSRRRGQGSAQLDYPEFPEGGQLKYTCDRDYVLEGTEFLTCQPNGRWSAPAPSCEKGVIYCPNPGPISNGKINYQPPFGSHRRGQVSSQLDDPEFPEGSQLNYTCDRGYALECNGFLTCRPNGRWNAPAPSCGKVVIYCPNPGPIINGKVAYHPPLDSRRRGQGSAKLDDPEFPQGGRLQFTCDRDYVMEGKDSLTCQPDGRWSAPPPSCGIDVTYCPNPGPISNGKIAYRPPLNSRNRGQGSAELDDPEFPEGGRLQYTCDREYTMEGSGSLTCQSDGRWSAPPPSCGKDMIYCPHPGNITNGKLSYMPPIDGRAGQPDDNEFPEGGRMQYYCNSKYTLEGMGILTCQSSGQWSSQKPSCVEALLAATPAFCPDPGIDPNGRRTFVGTMDAKRGFPAGSRIEYSCYQGLDMEGENSLYCFRTGKWSSERPRCKPQYREPDTDYVDAEGGGYTYCPNPGPIENGRMMYYAGFIRQRKRRDPVRQLEDPEFPPEGYILYVCDPGHAMDGRNTIYCQRTGEWDQEPPTCRTATSLRGSSYCYNPGPMPNGRAVPFVPNSNRRTPDAEDEAEEETYEEYPRGTRLEYSCDNGYSLQGPTNITCRGRGRWSEDPPLCITTDPRNMQYCVNPGPILNGRIRYFNSMARPRTGSTSLVAEDTPEYPEGTRLEYQCGDSYIMEGAFQLKCHSDGQWSDFPPKCVADCGRSIMGTTRRILHGNKTVVGEWPWVVAIGIRQNNFTRLVCGGAVLNTETIVTAAHCLAESNQFVLYFGKYHRSDSLDDAQVLVRTSVKLIVHPDYSNATMDNDIALVKFKPKINFTDRVQPICLPSAESTTYNLVSGRSGYVTGWGWTERRLSSDELLLAKLPYVSNSDCIDSFRRNVENFNGSLTQNMFCAGYREGKSQATCRGDSGAPFVFYDTLVERYTLEGLVSFGIEGQCGLPGMYSVFTKVYRFLPWIYRNL